LNYRFVRSGTWLGLANPDGSSSPRLTDKMAELAKGGVGLIISSFAFISREGHGAPGQLGNYGDELLPGLRSLASGVHEAGGRIVMQIAHCGLFASPQLSGLESIGPSVMVTEKGPVGREMSRQEIRDTVRRFGEGAARAQQAAFDGVQVHAAHGFLLSQFLSPFLNKRKDEYGGSLENRTRIVLEVVQSVRGAVGKGYPVLVKINSEDVLQGGFTVDDMLQVAGMLGKAGADALEISGGTVLGALMGNMEISYSPTARRDVYWEAAARRCRKAYSGPLMLVGGIRSVETARRLVDEGVADYVSLSRPLIREPGLVKRWESGDLRDAACVSDDVCLGPGMEGKGVACVHVKAGAAA
jgi:2,4-dienoyl-CoA reductase-like NADH-dependent reductase (Old Yellow Enzyme family)